MKSTLKTEMTISRPQRLALSLVALFGLLGPNGIFLYFVVFRLPEFLSAMKHPVTLAFFTEAFVVMILLAQFIARKFSGRWGWKVFVLLSLIGGLSFSIPFFVLANCRVAIPDEIVRN